MNRSAVILALALAALPSCVSRIAESSDPAADVGPRPDDHQSIARRWFESNVPVLATIERFEAEPPTHGTLEKTSFGLGTPVHGWRTVATASGKDSLGMSTGRISYVLLIRDGAVVGHQRLW